MLTVAAIIPAYNREPYLAQAIQSALDQQPQPHEIWVIDDRSTDRTAEIARSFGPPVRVIELKRRSGPGAARNAGIRATNCDIIAFLDSDDLWLPGHVARLIQTFETSPLKPGLVYENGEDLFESPRPEGIVTINEHEKIEGWVLPQIVAKNFINLSTVGIRRELFGDQDFFQDDLPAAEDWLLWRRASSAMPFAYTGAKGAVYRHHAGNATKSEFARQFGIALGDFYSTGLTGFLSRYSEDENHNPGRYSRKDMKRAHKALRQDFVLRCRNLARMYRRAGSVADARYCRVQGEMVRPISWTAWGGLNPQSRTVKSAPPQAASDSLDHADQTKPAPPRFDVSVVIPCYNCAPFVEATVRSAMGQILPPLEILCVDDASDDGTIDVLRRLEAEAPEVVKVIRHETRKGTPGAARNTGVRAASGNWIAFLDHDDFWMPEKLEKQWELLERHPGAQVLHSACWERTFEEARDKTGGKLLAIDSRPLDAGRLFLENTVYCLTAVVRRDALMAAGEFEESADFFGVDDYDMWLRLARNGREFAGTNEPLAVWRRHAGNASRNRARRDIGVSKALAAFLKGNPEAWEPAGSAPGAIGPAAIGSRRLAADLRSAAAFAGDEARREEAKTLALFRLLEMNIYRKLRWKAYRTKQQLLRLPPRKWGRSLPPIWREAADWLDAANARGD